MPPWQQPLELGAAHRGTVRAWLTFLPEQCTAILLTDTLLLSKIELYRTGEKKVRKRKEMMANVHREERQSDAKTYFPQKLFFFSFFCYNMTKYPTTDFLLFSFFFQSFNHMFWWINTLPTSCAEFPRAPGVAPMETEPCTWT